MQWKVTLMQKSKGSLSGKTLQGCQCAISHCWKKCQVEKLGFLKGGFLRVSVELNVFLLHII